MRPLALFSLLSLPLLSQAARGGSKPPPVPDDDWATYHLAEEHHLNNFDPGAMFKLHDFDDDGFWDPEEVRRMYGLEDPKLRDTVSESKREEVTREVFKMYDTDKDGRIDRQEWLRGIHRGDRLPDFGLGPGHHGDDEYEYEIHHFEKFHGPDTKEEDLIHPEDIEHFAMHDKLDEEAEIWDRLYQQPIIDKNIPAMFRQKQA